MLQVLNKVPLLSPLPRKTLVKIADGLEDELYENGEYIIRQGEIGDTFYIIRSGEVDVTENSVDEGEAFIRTMVKGEYFGEKALRGEQGVRTVNVIAKSSTVQLMTLDKAPFRQLIGNLADKHYVDSPTVNYHRNSRLSHSSTNSGTTPRNHRRSTKVLELMDVGNLVKRESLQLLTRETLVDHGILGIGGFGRVALVSLPGKPNESFALKCMKKVSMRLTFAFE